MTRGLALGALLASFIACASSQRMSAPATRSDAGAQPMIPTGNPHADIEALERDIVAHGGKLVPQDMMATALQPMAVVPKSTDATCQPAPTDRCGDSCKLSDSICDDAKKICDIASTLPGDDWAAGKCESGKTSCTDAHASCCTCH